MAGKWNMAVRGTTGGRPVKDGTRVRICMVGELDISDGGKY